MKKKLMNFIATSNQVVFFLGSIIVIAFVVVNAIHDWTRSWSPSGVEVVSTKNGTNEPPNMEYTKSYFRTIKDIHIIKVFSEKIYLEEQKASSGLYNLYSGDYVERHIVNLIFSDESGSSSKLFSNDRLITRIKPAHFNKDNSEFLLNKNIYFVVSADSNNDGLLNYKDHVELYSSEYDGSELKLLFEDVEDSEQIDHNRLLVTVNERDKVEIYVYDVASDKKILLNTYLD